MTFYTSLDLTVLWGNTPRLYPAIKLQIQPLSQVDEFCFHPMQLFDKLYVHTSSNDFTLGVL